jgi:hypothetical protein
MVDFQKLRTNHTKAKPIEPIEIFRRLPKPAGINDLYTSQAEVLQQWYDNRAQKDTVLKLHTGGGKTLVGLLIAQSTLNELREPVLYLAPTVQLVNQTIEKAKAHGIAAVPYESGKHLHENFVNGNAVMVATYKALFNGMSKFKVRGNGSPQKVLAVIMDDAHAAFSELRDVFTLVIPAESKDRFQSMCGLFRSAFKDSSRLGTFDDILNGRDGSILEVPYSAWRENLEAIREQLKSDNEEHKYVWPLLRDNLHLCHALISRTSFSITPILPLVDLFPSFSDASRRIFMSATIADDSEIIRTFDADVNAVRTPLTSRSLAGVSERMILIPDLMRFTFDIRKCIGDLLKWTTAKGRGAVILLPSNKAATSWSDVATIASGSDNVEKYVLELQERKNNGPIAFANRYDGIDLPGDSCRLLALYGLPSGTSNYELHRAAVLYNGSSKDLAEEPVVLAIIVSSYFQALI